MDISTGSHWPLVKFVALPVFATVGLGLTYRHSYMIGTFLERLKRWWLGWFFNENQKELECKIADLEDRLRKSGNEKNALNDEVRKFKTENNRLSSTILKTNEENSKLKQTLRQEQDAKASAHRTLEKERKEGERARGAYQQEVGTLKQQLEARKAEITEARGELQRSQSKLAEVTTLLDTRTKELKGAQVFLTTADAVSGAEVISSVDALNAEILQTCCTRISDLMGTSMTHLLSTVQHTADPLLVQIALQGATVEFSRWIIMTWDFDGLQAEQQLSEIYNDIRSTETQAISGRWRALTRAHVQKVALQHDDLHSTMAGCTKNYEDAYREFTQKFGERVSNIVKMAVRLNKIIGEEVTSADLWPTHGAAGEKFDSDTMDDFEGPSDQTGKPVLCTTALGLARSEKLAVTDAAEFKYTVLKKPKVALESVADGLEREEVSS
ncbi:hypothetical protein EV401DRAFT_2068688 [Pisolithus croceorrhizus]|nr:hypothetical protein EV401DRAFT_2068688 [Pisolithus croceorrhizus]